MAKLPINRFLSLDDARTHYLHQVDRLAQGVSGTVSAAWQAKWQEVQNGGGPLLTAEAEALGLTEAEVIERVTAARQAWGIAEAAREAARIRAKHHIRQAENPADMHRAHTTYKAALEAAFS